MAGRTGRGEVGKVIIDMAFCAAQAGMGTRQGELRPGMVECSREPGSGGVAGAAIRTKLTIMRIILSVAGITIGGQVGEDSIEVTLGTGNLRVGTSQRELCLRMIEGSRKPGSSGVAHPAVRSELIFVSIILGVTRITVGRQTGKNTIQVALCTGYRGMGTSEREL
jgi:hypothetical protein